MTDNVIPWPDSSEEARERPARRPSTPAWWHPEPSLAPLPENLRPAAERLADLVIAGDDAKEAVRDDWIPASGLEAGAQIIAAVRRAAGLAAARGAPPLRVQEIHARLDEQAFALARFALAAKTEGQARFLEDVSHDIRSPLNSILFLADALRNAEKAGLGAIQTRQVNVLYTAAVTLVKLVNDLIDFARLGEGREIRVASTTFSVESVIGDVRRLVAPLIDHRNVRLDVRIEPSTPRSGDPQLLSRVVLNLVSNAVQAVDEGGRVAVVVTDPRDGWLRIEVTDDGVGTDVERLRRMIAPIPKGERAGETRGWTHGLGLSISARLVRAAGGEIAVESVAREGTCFRVDLPFPRL